MDGWSLLYKSVEKDVEKKSDLLIVVTHWQLLHSGLKCLGLGDDKTLSELDEESEELPAGWNNDKVSYSLRYKYKNDVFVLIGTVTEDATMMLNLLNGTTLSLSNVELVLDETVVSLTGKLSALIPNISKVITCIQKDLVEPVLAEETRIPNTESLQFNDQWFSAPPAPFLNVDYDPTGNDMYRTYWNWRTSLPLGPPTPHNPYYAQEMALNPPGAAVYNSHSPFVSAYYASGGRPPAVGPGPSYGYFPANFPVGIRMVAVVPGGAPPAASVPSNIIYPSDIGAQGQNGLP